MIIFVNGTSSAGKSTVAMALQEKLGDGWLYFSMDGYLSMLGTKFGGLHPKNLNVCEPNEVCYAKKHGDGTHEIITGKLCIKLFDTIPDVLVLVAEKGFNVIVDSLMTSLEEFNTYKKKLEAYGILFVYLHAPLEIIIAREKSREDRLEGSAIHWLKSFECIEKSDLIFNTHDVPVEKITADILQFVDYRC